MPLKSLALITPDWLTIWVAILAIGAFILGFKRAGSALMAWPIIDWILLPILLPVIDQLPPWVALALAGIFSLLILQAFLMLIFPKEAVGHVIGTYLVRLCDFLLLGPFRSIRWLYRLFIGDRS